jgi:hypothetical protein
MSQKEKLKLVYKYETINEHLFENLEKNQLYFEDPRKYNDPLDSKVNGHIEYTEKQFYEYILNSNSGANQIQVQNHINQLIRKEEFKRDTKTGLIKEDVESRSSSLTCCFSEKRNNILMWSHYANKHKGICLNYKTIQVPRTPNFRHTTTLRLTVNSIPTQLFEMKYQTKKPTYKNYAEVIIQNDAESLFDNLLTKSICWKYEKERRIISLVQKNIQNFKKEELEGIIFGLKVKHYDAYKVHKIMEKYYINKGININFYKPAESKINYTLNITKIEEDKIDDYIESLT